MPVPGLPGELPLRAKVRCGAKTDKGYPTSFDYFVCPDDKVFAEIVGERPSAIQITFPYQTVEQAFPSGLEKWLKSKQGRPILACYTKGDGTAWRRGNEYLPDGSVKLDPTAQAEGRPARSPMPCAAKRCPFYGKAKEQGCRPQGRLNFQIPGGPRDSVYRFETKGHGTIKEIHAVLSQYPDLRSVVFELRVGMVSDASGRYPVVHISEVGAPPSPSDVEAAGPTSPAGAVAGGAPIELSPEQRRLRSEIKRVLGELGQYPPSRELAKWIAKQGYAEAFKKLDQKLADKIEAEQRGE